LVVMGCPKALSATHHMRAGEAASWYKDNSLLLSGD
jgi:hypothetical protein